MFTALLVLLSLTGTAADASATLPTPYTAEAIRDAWPEGMWLVTRTTTPDGTTVSKTTVTAWSVEEVTMTDQPLDDQGQPVGPATTFVATWSELRDHARFPEARARRERAQVTTALGTLDGWRYVHRHDDGAVGTFFFADAYPGSPVMFRQIRDGETVLHVEQQARYVPPEPAP